MTIVLAIAFSIMTLFLYIHFSIKSKDLSIKILDQQEAKKVFENLLANTKQDLIKIKEKFNNEKKLSNEFRELNLKLSEKLDAVTQQHTALQATFQSEIKQATEKARADSVKRQRSILKGQATEHLAPYINSNYNPKDYKFIGDPIDYIIYEGLSEIKETDRIEKIIFMDIKTGGSNLTKTQRRIRDAIADGRVEFQIYKPEEDIADLQQASTNIEETEG